MSSSSSSAADSPSFAMSSPVAVIPEETSENHVKTPGNDCSDEFLSPKLKLTPDELVKRQRMQQKLWRVKNPERTKELQKRYNDKPHVKQLKLDWSRRHREEINERRRQKYAAEKMAKLDFC